MSTLINRDEWLEALGEANKPEEDPLALSINEIATLFKLKRDAARRRAERLVEEGKATEVSKFTMTKHNGERRRVRAFRLLPKSKKK